MIFTTIQKFSPAKGEAYPLLTDRRNVIVLADEAHRSQCGFRAKVDSKTGEIGYGFAKYLRDALPNASFIGFTGTPIEQEHVNTPAVLAGAIDWIRTRQQQAAAQETTPERKKRAHRRYQDAVLALSKVFALAAASDEARSIRDEVGFFQTVRAALAKPVPQTANGSGKTAKERELAIAQIVSRAVVSTEIVDILRAVGMRSPDISILSDEFLAEVQGMQKQNLATEALRKLLNGEIRSRGKRNVVQTVLQQAEVLSERWAA